MICVHSINAWNKVENFCKVYRPVDILGPVMIQMSEYLANIWSSAKDNRPSVGN